MTNQLKMLSKSPLIIEDQPPLVSGYPCDFNGMCPFGPEDSISSDWCRVKCGVGTASKKFISDKELSFYTK